MIIYPGFEYFFSNSTLFLWTGKIVNTVVRWASKKAGGSSRNRKGHAPGKRRGIKAQDGSYVTQSSILIRQLHIRCHPGLNVCPSIILNLICSPFQILLTFQVGIGKDGTLYALEAGKVLITCEKFQPNFEKYWTEKAYGTRRDNIAHVYKKYFHVIPDPLEPKFKLVDQIWSSSVLM